MISSVPSYDEELVNSAYANIGLIADKGWAFHQDDPFRKLNHTLWVQNCKLTARYRENGNYQPRFVRDTIPGSWLAQYGNYEYNEERERMYKPCDNTPVVRPPDFYNGAITEPWMLEEVEEHFARLNSRTSLPLNDDLSTQMPSSVTEGLDSYGKVTSRETGRFVQSRWDAVLRKRYSTLEQVLATKNSNGKESALCTPYTTHIDELHHKNVDPEDYIKYPPLRYTVDNMAEMQLQIHVTSDAVRNLWNPSKSPHHQQQQQQQQPSQHQRHFHRHQQYLQCGRQQQHHHHHPQCNKQQYLQCGMQYQTLAMRLARQSPCSESVGMMRQPPPPMLSAEVPEFFPKGPLSRTKGHQEQSLPLQFFPSSAERSYQDELFPYNRVHVPGGGNVFQSTSIPTQSMPIHHVSNPSSLIRPSHQWIQRPSPGLHVQVPVCLQAHQSVCTSVQPVCSTMMQRRIQMHDKITGNMTPQGGGLPSAPIPVYQRPPELYNDPSQRRKNQGVDFNNLILLTKTAMKARRNQSKTTQQSSGLVLESKQPDLKSETDVLQWLEKGCPKRAKEFLAVNILVSDFRNLEKKCDDGKTVSLKKSNEDINATEMPSTALDKSPGESRDADPSSDAPTKRRLYRDVLTNSTSTGIILGNVFDKRYDELERQAMEQYRTSEECLALRYQELERQAMEQYRNCDNGTASTSTNQSTSPTTPTKGAPRNQSQSVTEDNECVGGHKCSGFGHCSPIKDSPSPSDKGTPSWQPLTISRPESKPVETSATYRVANHTICTRPAVVTKSLTTLSQRSSRDSKNTTRGASGDKIDRTVQASPKRRLILMSPSKRESEARPMETSNSEETYTFESMNTRESGSYRKPQVIQTGGGDEKVTILRSPGAEGIRKQLFVTNEELTDSSSESLGVRLLEPSELDETCMKLDLVKTLKKQILGVSSRTAIATVVDTPKEDEDEHSVSGIRNTILKQQQEHTEISNHVTKNMKKQLTPHNLAAVKKPKFYCPNAPLTRSVTFFPRDEKCHGKLVDSIPRDDVLTTKVRCTLKNSYLKLKLESGYRKMYQSFEFPTMTFAKQNYLTLADFLPYSSSIVESVYYSVSFCSTTQIEPSEIFIPSYSYPFPTQFGMETDVIYSKKICSQHFLMVQHYDTILLIKRYKIPLLNPSRVVPLWDNSEVNDLWEMIASGTARRRIQTNNFSSANNCTQLYAGNFRHEAISEVYFDVASLRIFPFSPFIPFFVGEQTPHHCPMENIY